MAELCIHELSNCDACNPPPKPVRVEPLRVTAIWDAYYDGECDECGGSILEGDPIGRLRSGGYVCQDCLRKHRLI